jgi:DNA repair protein SbcC/Rad50
VVYHRAINTMFNKIFKKDSSTTAEPSQAQAKPTTKPTPVVDTTDWQAKLAEATDDIALLAIAKEKAPLKIRQAAIEAMQTEDGLKAAEREFRDHDRSVHRDAKRRLERKIAERLAAAEAASLIEGAEQLALLDSIPANRLVEIDRAWNQLDLALLDAAQTQRYQAASEKITQLLRSRGDLNLLVKRWMADADRALVELQAGSVAVAETGLERDKLGAAYETVNQLYQNAPAIVDQDALARDVAYKSGALDAALQVARALDARLTFLDKVISDHDAADMAAWLALPVVTDAKVAALLNARFEASRKTQQQAHDIAKRANQQETLEQKKAATQAKLSALNERLSSAEAELAAGHIIEATTSLAAIEAALKDGAPQQKVQSRLAALRAEITRLKGWQHWGGGRVREDLVTEAETLAKAITDEKLHIKTHADSIEKLRERWKELDKLGGATNRELWTNFDNALKTAYLPVSAQLAKLKAVRQENLGARNALISTLDATPLPTAQADTAVTITTDDLRAFSRALEHFQVEWRKLGPVEHTVPHKSQEALLKRMNASVARLETPLNDARRVEALKREKLIARAKALSADSRERETINKVRELQAEWQQHAKSLPLQRNVENKLWAEFKAATDAVFQARDAENTKRDAVFQANAAVRDELIAKLLALTADSPPNEIKRTLTETDQAWRRAGEAPRAIAAKIDARYRSARDAASQYATGSAKRAWQKVAESLIAKVALCESIESGNANRDTVDESWNAHAPLTAWDKPLRARLDNAGVGTPLAAVNRNDELLKLEAALDMDSPAEFQAARREMKLRAMKNAIEARQAVTVSNADISGWISSVISTPLAETQASTRLSAILRQLLNKPLGM